MIDLFKDGGPVMWPLLACALAGIAIIFERFVVLHRMPSAAKAEKQLDDVENALSEGGLEGCAQKVAKGKGVLNYIFARLLRRYDTLLMERRELAKTREEVSGAAEKIEDSATRFLMRQAEITEFRDEFLMTISDSARTYVTRFLPALNTVGVVSPLLGLLGTIIGMIVAFSSIAQSGTGDPRVVAGGISQALITTATGLVIAVPVIVFYRYLGQKAETSMSSVEVYATTFSHTLLALLEKE